MEQDVAALDLLPAPADELHGICGPGFTCGTTNCGETFVLE